MAHLEVNGETGTMTGHSLGHDLGQEWDNGTFSGPLKGHLRMSQKMSHNIPAQDSIMIIRLRWALSSCLTTRNMNCGKSNRTAEPAMES